MLGWPFSSLPNSKATQRRASTAPAALFVHEKCWVNTFRLWFGLVAVREFNAVDLTNVKQWGLERGCWLDEPSQLVRFVLPCPPKSSQCLRVLVLCWTSADPIAFGKHNTTAMLHARHFSYNGVLRFNELCVRYVPGRERHLWVVRWIWCWSNFVKQCQAVSACFHWLTGQQNKRIVISQPKWVSVNRLTIWRLVSWRNCTDQRDFE
jgi:hypothetical protein